MSRCRRKIASMNVDGKDPSSPSGVLNLSYIYPRCHACSQQLWQWENDVHSPRFLTLLLSFLIDRFPAVIPHLLDCFSLLSTPACSPILSVRREYTRFFSVVWFKLPWHGSFVTWCCTFPLTESLFQCTGEMTPSHWVVFWPSVLLCCEHEPLFPTYRLTSVQREYFDWALCIFSGYNDFLIPSSFHTSSHFGREVNILDLS